MLRINKSGPPDAGINDPYCTGAKQNSIIIVTRQFSDYRLLILETKAHVSQI